MSSGLLVHLVGQFVKDRERVATEALTYLAQEYPTVRQALGALAHLDPEVRELVAYRSEVTDREAEGRPDIVGKHHGRRLLVLEGKFWAPLTASQPCGYLRDVSSGGAVVFLCPGPRIPTLCDELEARIHAEALGQGRFVENSDLRSMPVTGNKSLIVMSWVAILGRIEDAAPVPDGRLAYELDQLRGFVNLLETELVEWSREELQAGLSHTTFRKAVQTADLLFDLLNREERATRQGHPRWEDNGSVYYRSRFRVGQVEVHVGFEPEQWKPTFPTPVTFGIKSDDVPDDLKQSVHHAYIKIVDRLRAADSAPVEQLSFTTSPLSATWWWGPLPIAANRPAEDTKLLLATTARDLLDAFTITERQVPSP